ncbi:DUF6781 family protein [Desulfobacula sp.]|uniref:DUF6781 family protein n=1 Tax=Desulfobacula sp. TaxID=2593537 RepID=UPI0025C35ACA|nr:DUF6781 family protein [Desulfobacula sp.]MBC2703615.1 hypothetical protein [Desulfobacula sp.]
MSENQMKDRIVEELRKAKEAGQITTKRVREIIEEAVSDVVSESKEGVVQLRSAVKDAVGAALIGLKKIGENTKETVEAAVEGAIAGARSHGDQTVEATWKEVWQLETRLTEERARLAKDLSESLGGAKDAGEILSGDVKKWVESAVVDVKLKSTQLLGLTRQTVKEAVKETIESGQDVKETVSRIASDATKKALEEGRFTADRVKIIVEKVLSGAVEAAEEVGKETKKVAHGAFEGTQKGIISAMESVEDKTKEFNRKDLARTREDLEVIEELFLETTRKIAIRSGEVTKDILTDLTGQARKTTSALKQKAHNDAEKTAGKMKEAGKDAARATAKAAHAVADEARELGKRSVDIAKGAVSGMWKGAKDALKKEKKDR